MLFSIDLQNPDFHHDDALSKIDCIMVQIGSDDETVYSKSISLHVSSQLGRIN